MRQGQSKRIRGRNRGGGNGGGGGGGGKGPNPLTRSYESNGPDVKIRGTAATIADKYVQLSRDAQSSGDPVAAENYLQHAEHYYRLLAAAQAQYQPHQTFVRADADDFTDSLDFDDEQEGVEPAPQPVAPPQGFNGGERQPRHANGNGNGQPYAGAPRDDDQQPRRNERRNDRNDRNRERGERTGERRERGPRPEWQERGERADDANVSALPAFITGGSPQPAFVAEAPASVSEAAPEPEAVTVAADSAPEAAAIDAPQPDADEASPRPRARRRRYGRYKDEAGEAAAPSDVEPSGAE